MPKNFRNADKALRKSTELSGFMGAYVIGRMAAPSKPEFALKHLRQASRAGHLPSAVLKHKLLVKRLPLIGVVVGFWFAIVDHILLMRAIHSRDAKRLWRSLDGVASEVQRAHFRDLMGADRKYPFARIESILVDATASPNSALQGDALAPRVRA